MDEETSIAQVTRRVRAETTRRGGHMAHFRYVRVEDPVFGVYWDLAPASRVRAGEVIRNY